MRDADIHAQYATGKDACLEVLSTKGADALVYKYIGQTPDDYMRVLEMPASKRAFFSKSVILNMKPTYQWSTTSARNRKLHAVHGAYSPGNKLVKVTIHQGHANKTAQQHALSEVQTHIAMVEYQSRYVPLLYDVTSYQIEGKWVNVMIMAFLTGAPLAKLYDTRHEKYGFKFVTAAERDQLEEALKDLWAVGGAHMDLHRNNIIITEQGHLYLIDFSRSSTLTRQFYTQALTLANQKKRIAAILGQNAPVMRSKEDVLSVASHYLYAYPELFALENMQSQRVQGRRSKQAIALKKKVRDVRQDLIMHWNKPSKRTWSLLRSKKALENKMERALGVNAPRTYANLPPPLSPDA